MNLITKTTELAMNIMLQYICDGDTVIDATAGNGNDTLVLANAVGENGNVLAFDIQNQAIQNTRVLLEQNGVLDRAELINDSHDNMRKYIEQERIETVSAVIFNLGYLPSGNKTITTTKERSKKAILEALKIIKSNGIVCLVLYSGHDEGKKEKEAILTMLEELSSKEYHVAYTSMINQKNSPPEIVWVTKK